MKGCDGLTALALAALEGNVALITFIVKTGGKDLLLIGDCFGTPLHWACLCSNKEKGYLAAKKLIQLGSPVNIANVLEQKNSDGILQLDFRDTPFETALQRECIQIATMILRLGGIARPDHYSEKSIATLEATRKEIMKENVMLFKLIMSKQKVLPNTDNHIPSISIEYFKSLLLRDVI